MSAESNLLGTGVPGGPAIQATNSSNKLSSTTNTETTVTSNVITAPGGGLMKVEQKVVVETEVVQIRKECIVQTCVPLPESSMVVEAPPTSFFPTNSQPFLQQANSSGQHPLNSATAATVERQANLLPTVANEANTAFAVSTGPRFQQSIPQVPTYKNSTVQTQFSDDSIFAPAQVVSLREFNTESSFAPAVSLSLDRFNDSSNAFEKAQVVSLEEFNRTTPALPTAPSSPTSKRNLASLPTISINVGWNHSGPANFSSTSPLMATPLEGFASNQEKITFSGSVPSPPDAMAILPAPQTINPNPLDSLAFGTSIPRAGQQDVVMNEMEELAADKSVMPRRNPSIHGSVMRARSSTILQASHFSAFQPHQTSLSTQGCAGMPGSMDISVPSTDASFSMEAELVPPQLQKQGEIYEIEDVTDEALNGGKESRLYLTEDGCKATCGAGEIT